MKRSRRFSTALLAAAVLAIALSFAHAARSVPSSAMEPSFGDSFWKRWGDGKGELSSYDLTFPRYGELRKGLAITVFVTETFSNSLRVKSDPGKHPKSDEFPVMKLSAWDFSTGIYDYNLLTSAFVALSPANGRPAGTATKSRLRVLQEWCGNVYSQIPSSTQARAVDDAQLLRRRSGSGAGDSQSQRRARRRRHSALGTKPGRAAAPPGERRETPLLRSIKPRGSATGRRDAESDLDARRVLERATAPARSVRESSAARSDRRRPHWTILVRTRTASDRPVGDRRRRERRRSSRAIGSSTGRCTARKDLPPSHGWV